MLNDYREINLNSWTQVLDFWSAFAKAYTEEDITAECKRFAALDVILLGHIQTLNWHERLFLGLLAKSLFKIE